MAIPETRWSQNEPLEANRQRLLKELRRRICDYEARYELRSDQVRKELKAGRLRETAEICDWVISIEAYQALQDG
ncbi:MAG: hypothetical protein HYU88_02320 [Chloroflexi bacterium]|nr:hypothetical protein [Chloroflexota bacterium]MBI4505616.1 hypothetical protein [Chloroflexota bacterium]